MVTICLMGDLEYSSVTGKYKKIENNGIVDY